MLGLRSEIERPPVQERGNPDVPVDIAALDRVPADDHRDAVDGNRGAARDRYRRQHQHTAELYDRTHFKTSARWKRRTGSARCSAGQVHRRPPARPQVRIEATAAAYR